MPDEDASRRRTVIDGLGPGLERRRALRQAGFNVQLSDFTEEEHRLRWGITTARRQQASDLQDD